MNENELRKRARNTGFDVATLEKDYALSWLLSGMYQSGSKTKDILIFKGGTAIRKVYFPEWRLSEDLDFTIAKKTDAPKLKAGLSGVLSSVSSESGIAYTLGDYSAGKYAVFASVQFLGPLGFKNRIAHDISLVEKLVEPPVSILVKPDYGGIPEFSVLVYSLNEILVEKLRSITQRGKARDYYDAWRLLQERDFDIKHIAELLEKKCEITAVRYAPELIFEKNALSEAKKFWGIALARLTKDLPAFEAVIDGLRRELKELT